MNKTFLKTLGLNNLESEIISISISVKFKQKVNHYATPWIEVYNRFNKLISKFDLTFNPPTGRFKSMRPSKLPYNFGEESEYKIKLRDKLEPDLGLIGESKFRLTTILLSKDFKYAGNFEKDLDLPASYILEMVPRKNKKRLNYTIDLQAKDVKDIEFFSKSDPFLILYRSKFSPKSQPDIVKDPEQIEWWIPVVRTEYYQDNLNPDFKPFEISSYKLCKDDPCTPLKLEIWDYSKRGKHTLISKAYFTLKEILNGKDTFTTLDDDFEDSGTVIVQDIKSWHSREFFDLIFDGDLQLKPKFFIDFDKRNFQFKTNLHDIKTEKLNIYEKTIQNIFSLIYDFFKEKKCEVYGFGINNKDEFQDSYLVPLNKNFKNPNIIGIGSFLSYYREFLDTIQPNCNVNYLRHFMGSLNNKILKKISLDKSKGFHFLVFMSPLDKKFNEETHYIKEYANTKNNVLILIIRICLELSRSDPKVKTKGDNFVEVHLEVDNMVENCKSLKRAFNQFKRFFSTFERVINK